MNKPNTKTRSIIALLISSTMLSACSSNNDFKKLSSQLNPSQQVVVPPPVIKKKPIVKPMNSDCNYIVRDLSANNSNDIWCVPRSVQ